MIWALWHCALSCWKLSSEDGYTVVIKGWTWSATILRLAVVFKRCSIGTKNNYKNVTHTITPPPPAWTVQTRQDGSMLSCSLRQILTLPSECRSRNRDSSDQEIFPNLLLSNFGEPVQIVASVPVLSWQERYPVWSSAAVVHLLQGLTCCAFRDCILHSLVVTSVYLSYFCLSIISDQSPLTSTTHFRPHNCRSLEIFSFSDHSL